MKWSIRQRRVASMTATLSLAVIWLAGAQWIRISLGSLAIYSGASLLACLVGLMLIGLRKRLVMLPLWSVSTWVQVHIYTGLFACIVYAIHVPAIVASGRFEGPLSCLFIVVAASGFYGVYISRVVPKRITNVSIQPRFDRIPWHRDQIANAAETSLSELAETSDLAVLKLFFEKSLRPYFSSSLSVRYLLNPSSAHRRRLLSELNDLDRYFDAGVLTLSKRLAALVRHRDDLDYQHAMQFRLRGWVLIHAGLSSVLVIWSLAHAFIALGMLGN